MTHDLGAPPKCLLVLHSRPTDLARWLDPAVLARTLILEPQRARHIHAGDVGLGAHPPTSPMPAAVDDPRVIRLPIDGPISAVETAALGLRRRLTDRDRTWILPDPASGLPPAPRLLRMLRQVGLATGVDLSSVDWVRADGLLWADEDGVAQVPLLVDRPPQSVRAASIIEALRGFDPASPVGTWISGCTCPGAACPVEQWELVLAAHYLEVVTSVPGLHAVPARRAVGPRHAS